MIARKKGTDSKGITKDFFDYTKFAIASCSNWLSPALVITFIDDGKFHLKYTVSKFLQILLTYGKGIILITQCLSHTTAINSGDIKESRKSLKDAANMDEAINLLLPPTDSKPDGTFRYSNTGLHIAATVIKKIGGKDFKPLFAERIAAKCGMRNTEFGDNKLPLAAGGALSAAKDYLQFL